MSMTSESVGTAVDNYTATELSNMHGHYVLQVNQEYRKGWLLDATLQAVTAVAQKMMICVNYLTELWQET